MKIGTLVTLTVLLLCGFAGAQNTFCSANGSCTVTGAWTFTGPNAPPQPASDVDWGGRNRFANFQDHTINQALMTGSDWGARVSAAWQMMVNLGWTNVTVDGRTHGVAQTSAGSFFTNYPYSPGTPCTFSGKIDFDAPIVTSVSQVVPCQAQMDGHSSHAGFSDNLQGGVIQRSNTFPNGTPVIQFGTASWSGVLGGSPPQGVQLHRMGVSCLPPNSTFDNTSVGILNQFAQEESFAEYITIDGCETGLQRVNGGTISGSLNDGPYHDLHIHPRLCDNVNCRAIVAGGNGTATNDSRGFYNISANTNGATVQPDIAFELNGTDIPFEKWHIEGFKKGVVLGPDTYARNIKVRDGTCTSLPSFNGTNCVEISSTNAFGNTDANTVSGIRVVGTWTNILVDGVKSNTVPATESVLGNYFADDNTVWSTSQSVVPVLPQFKLNVVRSPTANTTFGMAGFQAQFVAGTSQGTTPLIQMTGNASNAGSTNLLSISTAGTNEKTMNLLNLVSQLSHSANGQVQLVPVANATSSAQVNALAYLQQSKYWDGATSQTANFTIAHAVTPSSGTAATLTVTPTVSFTGTALTRQWDFTAGWKVLSNNIYTNNASNTDLAGTIAISASSTGTYTFAKTYASAPICQLTPTSDPTATGVYWATTTTTVLTANVKVSGTITFNYHCFGRT